MGGASGLSDDSGTDEVVRCDGATLMPGNHNRTLDVDGRMRTFILHVPPGYDGETPTPLVFDFHGSDGTGREEQRFSGMQRVSDAEGFLVAFPDSLDGEWNVGPCCSRDDDMGFTQAMLEAIATEGCVDRKRVYATGFSMGGGMSHFLACEGADFIAAVTPAAFDHIEATEAECAPVRPVSVLSFRGTEDDLVPFQGGLAPARRVTFLGAHQSLARWAEIDGCTAETTTWNGCTIHADCDDGVQVGLCVDQGGGHTWGDARISWDFLRQFSLP